MRALAHYPTGLALQPNLGSGVWWLWRLAWGAVLTAVTAAELMLLWLRRSLFARPSTTVPVASALIYAAGVALVSLSPVGTGRSPVAPKRLRPPKSFAADR